MKILGGVEEHLWVQSPQQFTVRRGSPEHPLGMEWAGTEAIQGAEVQPLSPSGSQSGCRNRQAGKELGCWKVNSREGVTATGVSPTYFPGGDAEAPEALGLLGCSTGHSRESIRNPS